MHIGQSEGLRVTSRPSVPPNADEMRAVVESALNDLHRCDAHLLAVNASERSLTHRLAVHLRTYISSYYDIDCEYNRYGNEVKRLSLPTPDTFPPKVETDSIDAVTVFPDIVVHKRGKRDDNLLVLEIKKTSASVLAVHDIRKLLAFLTDVNFEYKFAVHLVIGYSKTGELKCTQAWGPCFGEVIDVPLFPSDVAPMCS